MGANSQVTPADGHVPASKVFAPDVGEKVMSLLFLGLVFGRPSAFVNLWERRNWYVLVMGAIGLPPAAFYCLQVMVWRLWIGPSYIKILSLRGFFKRELSDLDEVRRIRGRVILSFKDGAKRTIPSLVGDLDEIVRQIAARRTKRHEDA